MDNQHTKPIKNTIVPPIMTEHVVIIPVETTQVVETRSPIDYINIDFGSGDNPQPKKNNDDKAIQLKQSSKEDKQ